MYIIADVRVANDDGFISDLLDRLSNKSFNGVAEVADVITGLDYVFHYTLVDNYKICEVSDNKTGLATFRLEEGKVFSYEEIERIFVQMLASNAVCNREINELFYEQITSSKSKELAKKYKEYLYQIIEKFGLKGYFIDEDNLTPYYDEEIGYYYYA